ncbi:tetratricopeptide repeat-containing sensor histidine kinase [Mucilaginibacter sp. JRF]|uniref:tetratricopeptide repeat-containing sensor histidine kinase n=1 Tax=Mucilaginibacter sp. JRF TaxID=2780088 RepID=UPI00187E681A|nr:tetratricopeptide repeat-containing sensor histidine kinase [Mucilaginibacter sp. JRF]MBE9586892.1 tetratricopeptide repeat-containing sensor histidine kinase [Mucilaginibacter sp. JRF]
MTLRNYLTYFLISLLLCTACYAQNTDSLQQLYNKAKTHSNFYQDTANISLLTQLSLAKRTDNTDTALLLGKQALKIARNTNYAMGEANAWSSIGSAYYVQGSYFLSLEAATNLMNVSSRIQYKRGIGDAYQLRGLIFLGQDEYKDAITEFSKALKIYKQLDNKFKMTRMLFDIGLSYDELRDTVKAFNYLNQAKTLAIATADEQMVAMTYNRMGETYYHSKAYKTAISYHNKVLTGTYQDKWENAFAYSGLAQAQYELGNYSAARQNATKSQQLAHEVLSLWDEVRALKILAKAYASLGDYEQAYKYNTLMGTYNDSLLNDNKEKKLNYLHLRQQRDENIKLEKQSEIHHQKTRFNHLLMVAIGVMAVCISIFAFIISRSNVQKTTLNNKLERRNKSIARQKEEISRQNEKLDAINHTKNQLFSVISHDLRGPFASMMQTIDLIRDDELTVEERDKILDNFYKQVGQISAMVNNLLLWANSQLEGNITQPRELDATEIANEIINVSGYLAGNKNVQLLHKYDGPKPVFADADHLKIIIQNLVGNAIKFTPSGGSVTITYSEDEDNQVIHIRDTGVGISLEKMGKLFKVVGKSISGYGTNHEQGAGIGLLLIKQFTEVNNGRLKLQSEPGAGTEVSVYLPKYAPAQ